MRIGKKFRKIFIVALFSLCASCIVSVSVSSFAKADQQEAFYMPESISRAAYLGEKTEIARITPVQEDAEKYSYTVIRAATGERVATEGYSFVPEIAGEYKCIYYYEFGGEAQTYSYVILAEVKETPVFTRDANYPNAFIGNNKYSVDALSAFDYTTGEKAEAEVVVTAKCNDQEMAITDGVFTPTYNGEGSMVELKYVATYNDVRAEQIYKIPVVNVYQGNKVDMSGLFYSTGVSNTNVTTECASFTANRDAEIQYANILHANMMQFTFGFGEQCEGERIVFEMTSYLDPSVKLSLTFNKGKQNSGEGTLVLNGNASRAWDFEEAALQTVVFDAANKKFTTGDGSILFEVNQDEGGGVFAGFADGLVKVSLRMEGVYGACDLNVYQINAQVITNDTEDYVSPSLVLGDMSLEATVGEKVVIKGLRAVDVVDPNATVTVKVSCMGKPVETTKNADGSYSFVPTQSGDYLMVFSTRDRSSNDGRYNKIVYVYDKQAPSIELKGSVPSTAKVGATLNAPDALAIDNEEGVRLQVMVKTPSAALVLLADSADETLGSSFTFEEAGEYVLYYYATDACYNSDVKSFVIVCGG